MYDISVIYYQILCKHYCNITESKRKIAESLKCIEYSPSINYSCANIAGILLNHVEKLQTI